MKKLLMIVAIAICGIGQVHAQFYAGGSLGFTSTKVSGGGHEESGSSFKILPEVGYQLNEQFAFGISLGYLKGYAALGSFDASDVKGLINNVMSTVVDLTSSDNIGLNLKSFRIAPYARYTVLESGKFQLFVDGVIGYSVIKGDPSKAQSSGALPDDIPLPSKEQQLTSMEVFVRPGVAVSLVDNFKIIAKFGTLGYQSLKVKDFDDKITRFGFDLDSNNLLLGAVFYF